MMGPMGPPGVSGYEFVPVTAATPTAGVNGFGVVSGVAQCSPGKRIVSGGFEAIASGGNLVASSSYPDIVANAWRITLRNTSVNPATAVQVRVYAICVSQ
jgi:hypothetical protein